MRDMMLALLHVLLGAIGDPAVIVDGHGVVRGANEGGNALFEAGDTVALDPYDRLRVVDQRAEQLIRQVAGSVDGLDSGIVEIEGAEAAIMYLSVAAVPDVFADGHDPSASAAPERPLLITVRRPPQQYLDARSLAASFALTPAQSRVLEKCLEGLGPAEIAVSLGRSRHTVRSQLQSIYRKTGVHGLAALVALATASRQD